VLCLLFLAAIGLKVRSDHDSHRATILAEAAGSAQVAAARTREVLTTARATIVSGARVSTQTAAAEASGLASVTAVGVFDPQGVLLQPELVSPADAGPMSAAAQMADATGWTGVVARGGRQFVPAIAVRGADGGTVVAFVSLSGLAPPGPGRRIVVTGDGGAVIAAIPAAGFPQAATAGEALGSTALGSDQPGAMLSQQADGAPLVVGVAPVVDGMAVYVARDRSGLDAMWSRNVMFFLLLFLGPVLAFGGVYFLVRGQAERFAMLRTMTREAERRLRIAMDGAQCGVWDWDLSADRVYMTQMMATTLGLSGAGRFDAEDVLASLDDDDRARIRAALQASVRIGAIDVTIKVPGDTTGRRLQIRGRAAHDRAAPGVVRAIGVAMEVTGAQAADSPVGPVTPVVLPTASDRGNEGLGPVVEALPGACAIWNRDRKLVVANREFRSVFKLPDDTVQPGADYASVSRLAAAQVVGGGMRPDGDTGAELVDLKSGIALRLMERTTGDGGLISFAIDITRQKADEERLLRSERQTRSVVSELDKAQREAAELAAMYNAARLKAEEASAAKSNFLANMSHELRTPLTAILGFSDMMRKQMYGPLGAEQYTEYARSIHESGEHLLALIVDVLDMAKVEAGKFEIHPKPTYIDELIEQVVRMVGARAAEKGVELEVDPSDIGQATIDPRAVKQILINLVGNAIKFTPSGGRVLIQTRGSVKDVTLRVVDTGVGISADALPRLGRPFEQIENDHSRAHEGTGLGLALCKAFTHLHGGTIDISSEEGVGTMVTVTLPRHSLSARDAA
jgi:two-component system cell cycle sensor histidine kinase PleC